MKKLIIIPLLALLTGCAYLNSTTVRKYPIQIGTNTVMCIETTHGRAVTFLDANSTLTKFHNSSSTTTIGTNTYGPGTYASGINESSSTTNLPATLNALNNILTTVTAAATK